MSTSEPRQSNGLLTFDWPLRVYYEDTDAGGIVFYANYLKFFERARTEWLRSLGINQGELREQTGGMFVVGETRVKYHLPARLDDELLVTAALEEKGRASMTIVQRAVQRGSARNPPAECVLCEGSIRIGWVDAATLRPARIPNHLLDALK